MHPAAAWVPLRLLCGAVLVVEAHVAVTCEGVGAMAHVLHSNVPADAPTIKDEGWAKDGACHAARLDRRPLEGLRRSPRWVAAMPCACGMWRVLVTVQ